MKTAADAKFWLTIFLPSGVAWEIGEGVIRTRSTLTGKIHMRQRYFDGPAVSWLAAARNVTTIPFCSTTKSHTYLNSHE